MRRELLLLQEMIHAAERIRSTIGDLDVPSLLADPMRRDAVLWNYTVLGEAASQLPADFKATFAAVAWADASRLRNRIVHGYWEIDFAILRGTARNDLPDLIEQLEAALASLSTSGDHSGDS